VDVGKADDVSVYTLPPSSGLNLKVDTGHLDVGDVINEIYVVTILGAGPENGGSPRGCVRYFRSFAGICSFHLQGRP
jgi:hypothetical protein